MPRSLIRDFMNPCTLSFSPETRIAAAEDLLWESQFSNVYVVDAEEILIGVVPDYDFLKCRSRTLSGDETLSSIMSPVSTVFCLDDSIEKALLFLCDNIHSCAPVVDQGKLVGAVDRRCLARCLRKQQRDTESERQLLERNLNHGVIAIPKFLQTGDFGRHSLGGFQKFPSS